MSRPLIIVLSLQISAVLVGFFAVQFGFIGHDAAHRCITPNPFGAWAWGQLGMTVVNGVSYHHWWERHNEHHANPNDDDDDPDLKDMAFAFSEQHAMKQTGIKRLTTKYQEYLLFFLFFFGIFSLRITSIFHVIGKWRPRYIPDIAFLAAHYAIFLGLPIYFLGPAKGLIFYIIESAFTGFYFGNVFIPNHLGMQTVTKDTKIDFMTQQLLTSRDITNPTFFNFIFGGLNYQIEHHLFPTMPRKHLKKAKIIVRHFCKEHSLPYHEETVRETYTGLVRFSRKMALTLRNLKVVWRHMM